MTGEHPIKKTTILLRTAEKLDTVDVNVKVDDERPWRVVTTLDNTGNSDTGYLRAGIGFQHTNLFNRDHTISMQYITSPSHPNKVSIYGLGYNAPVYSLNSSFDFFAGYSDVNSGVVCSTCQAVVRFMAHAGITTCLSWVASTKNSRWASIIERFAMRLRLEA